MSIVKPRPMPPFQKKAPARKGPGKRTQKRMDMNRELGKMEIKQCEIRLPGCWYRSHLSWAHSKKSRFITTDADWMEAARACAFCHHTIEAWSHAAMKKIILEAIARRKP